MIKPTKNKEHIQVQVGAFLALGILFAMMAIFMLGSKTSLFQRYYTLTCYFDDISGLRVGAPVQLAGINVGFISEISFEKKQIRPKSGKSEQIVTEEKKQSEEEPKSIVKVKVQMKIDTSYQERIRTDSIASVVTQGLLGDRMVYITVGSSEENELKNGDEIVEVKNPTGFSQLVQKSDALIFKAEGLIESLDKVMDAVVDGESLVHDVIFEKKSSDVLDSAQDMFASLDEMGQNLEDISGKINNGQGTLGALVNDESLYNDLKTLLGKANRNRLVRAVIRYTMETKEKEQLK